jgi:hypothetical protein
LIDVTVAADQWPTAYDAAMEDEKTQERPSGTEEARESQRRVEEDAQRKQLDDPVDDASDDSFPASDPPSFTRTTD